MDKSLKKLSKLELLELMVNLSEENDILRKENANLHFDLKKQRQQQKQEPAPSLPRTAKVGSIAELALTANGFFESAQRAADDYLREIKRMRDQLSARVAAEGANSHVAAQRRSQVTAQATADANAIIRDAQQRAQAVMRRANQQAESLKANARMQSDAMLADARRQSQVIVMRANQQADAVVSAAHADAQRQAAAALNSGWSASAYGRHSRTAAEGR